MNTLRPVLEGARAALARVYGGRKLRRAQFLSRELAEPAHAGLGPVPLTAGCPTSAGPGKILVAVDDHACAAARRMETDLVAVGKHGKSWFEDLFAGSVALRVLRKCPADLLVVPPRHDQDAAAQ